MPGARPRAPRRALLGIGLVQAGALDRLLGRVRPPGDQAALRARRARNLVVRRREGREGRALRLTGRAIYPPAHNRRSIVVRPMRPCSVQAGEAIGATSDRYTVTLPPVPCSVASSSCTGIRPAP